MCLIGSFLPFPLLFLSDQLIILTHTNTKIHRNTIISAQLISDKHKYLNPRTSADSFPLTHRLLRLHPLVRSSPPEYKDFKIVGFIILPQENDSFCWMPQTCSLLLHLQIAGCNTSFIDLPRSHAERFSPIEFLEFGTSWSLPEEGRASKHFWYLWQKTLNVAKPIPRLGFK